MMRALFGGTDEPDEPEPARYAEDEPPPRAKRSVPEEAAASSSSSPPAPPPATTEVAVQAVPSFIMGERFFDFVVRVDVQQNRPGETGRVPRGVRPRLQAGDDLRFGLTSSHYAVTVAFGSWKKVPLHFNHLPTCVACRGEAAALGFVSGSVYFRAPGRERQMSELGPPGGAVVALRLEPPDEAGGGEAALWAAFADRVLLLRPAQEEPVALTVRTFNVTALDASRELLAVARASGECCLFDRATGAERGAFRTFFGAALCVAFSPDGRLVAAGGEDDMATLFSVAAGGVVARCAACPSFVTSLVFAPDGRALLCLCDSQLALFRLPEGEAAETAAGGAGKAEVPLLPCVGYAGGFQGRLSDVVWRDCFLVLAFVSGVACVYSTDNKL